MTILMQEKAVHIPVLSREVKEYLQLPLGSCFMDCTVGLGGHAKMLASEDGVVTHLIGIDRDEDALEFCKDSLSFFKGRLDLTQEDFRNLDRVLSSLGVHQVDGMLFDLGVSSLQLDDPERGFSIKSEGPLDMRMSKNYTLTAFDLINTLSEREISGILKDYGEERFHKRIARRIVETRVKSPLETTKDLCDVVLRSVPGSYKWQKIHPATRTFQAFRIMVNRELESLEIAMDKCLDFLKPGARLCVISFHSLEDRVVKHKFRFFAGQKRVKLIVKKPVRPSDEEASENPRARSARLRVIEKI